MKKFTIIVTFVLSSLLLKTGCEKKEGIEEIFCFECTTYSTIYHNKATYCNMTPSEAAEFEMNNTGYYNGEYIRTICEKQ